MNLSESYKKRLEELAGIPRKEVEIYLVGAPSGRLTKVNISDFNKLKELNLVMFDDEPDGHREFFGTDKEVQLGQWSYNDDETDYIEKIIGKELPIIYGED